MLDRWKLKDKKDCFHLNLVLQLSESQIEQIFQPKKQCDNIFIESMLSHKNSYEIGRHLSSFNHLKGLGIKIHKQTLLDLEPLKIIAKSLLNMKELNSFQLILDWVGDSGTYVSCMSELASNLCSLQNLTHLSLFFEQTEKISYEFSNIFKESLKELKALTHFEFKLEVENRGLLRQSSFDQFLKSLKYLTNLICLQILIGYKCAIGNEGIQYISSSLENLLNLQHLSLQFQCAQGTTNRTLSPLKSSLLKLKALKELNIKFQDPKFDMQDQVELLDAVFQLEELEDLSILIQFLLHNNMDLKLGTQTLINSKLKKIKLLLFNTDFQKDNISIQFDKNILRISKLESLVLSFTDLVFNQKGREVFDQLIKQNNYLKKLKIRNNFYFQNRLDFLINFNPILSNTSSLQKLSLSFVKETYLQFLINQFSTIQNSRLEELSLDIQPKKVTQNYDLAQIFQPLKHLKKLKLNVNIHKGQSRFIETSVLSLQHLPTLETLMLAYLEFDIVADNQMFEMAFKKLVNLKKLDMLIYEITMFSNYSCILNTIASFQYLISLQYLNLWIPFDYSDIENQSRQLAKSLQKLPKLLVVEYYAGEKMIGLQTLFQRKLKRLVCLSFHSRL